MNHDDLISKYLDGELTNEEDMLLRSKISEDENIRDKFYSSVSIHLAFKEDAKSIFPPKELVMETEEKIMLKILAQQAIVEEKVPLWRRAPVLASLLILAFFVSLFRIYDLPEMLILGNYANNSSFNSENPAPRDNVSNPALAGRTNDRVATARHQPAEQNVFAATGGTSIALRSGSSNSSPTSTALSDFSEPVTNPNESSLDESLAEMQPEASADNSANLETMNPAPPFIMPGVSGTVGNSGSAPVSAYSNIDMGKAAAATALENKRALIPRNSSMRQPMMNYSPVDFSEFGPSTTDIILTSFLGTDIARGGIKSTDNSVVSHFSQSIAYAMNAQERLGLEVGYTEYGYDETTFLSVGTLKPKINKAFDEPQPGEVDYISVPVEFPRRKQMFWGSAFYEHSLINTNALALNGRLGLGASDEGPLGYARLYGGYELFSGLYLTLGAEGRMFIAQLPKLSKDKDNLKSTLSLIYGLQFKF